MPDANNITIAFAYVSAVAASGLAGMAVYQILSYVNTRNEKDMKSAAISTAGAVINVMIVLLAIGSIISGNLARIS